MKLLRLVAALLCLATVAALASLVLVVFGAPGSTGGGTLALSGPSSLGMNLTLTAVSATLLTLVTGIGALVSLYSVRNLAGQQRVARFAALACAVVAALSITLMATSLPVLAVGWTAAGLAMSGLVAHTGTDRARSAARSVRRRLLVGDAALWTAVIVCHFALGTVAIDELAGAAASANTAVVALAGLLVVIAGSVRSSLVPAHRWLPEVAEAPSPVSALLHAGFVNGIGVIALLLWPFLVINPTARIAALVLGVVTALLGMAQQRVRPDVKGRLASSTTSQMGYLSITVGLGIPAAVLVHLIGHGLWKAGLFLGAGGAVERVRRAASDHHATSRGWSRFAAVIGAAIAIVAAVVPGPWGISLLAMPGYLVPVTVSVTAVAMACMIATLRSRGSRMLTWTVVVVGGVAYLLLLRAVDQVLARVPTWEPPTWGQPGALPVAIASAIVIAIGVVAWCVDAAARHQRLPGLVAAVARTTSAPSPLTRRVSIGDPALPSAAVTTDVATMALDLASVSVAPLWPLHAFVASSPISGYEGLPFADATRAATSVWGARAGIDAPLLRSAVADGVVTDEAIQRVAQSVAAGPDLALQGPVRQRAELVQVLMLADEADAEAVGAVRAAFGTATQRGSSPMPMMSPAEIAVAHSGELAPLDARCRDLVSHYAARAYGGTAWPSEAPGVWGNLHRDAAQLDRLLGTRGTSRWIGSLSPSPREALLPLIRSLDLNGGSLVSTFTRVLTRDPGWVGHLAWRQRQGIAVGDDELLDLLVSRLALESVVSRAAGAPQTRPEIGSNDLAPLIATMVTAIGVDVNSLGASARASLIDVADAVNAAGLEVLRLRAWEESYREPVLESIAERAAELATGSATRSSAHEPQPRPAAQIVTCIDVRSERLRRQLEARGAWETFGAAGFFGLAFSHVSPSGHLSERLPALLRPEHEVREVPLHTRNESWLAADLTDTVHGIETAIAAPFSFAEAAGWVTAPAAAMNTVAPRWWQAVRTATMRRFTAPTRGQLLVEHDTSAPDGFDLTALIDAAYAFLRTTGLLEPADVVLLVGHGGKAANNPHVAAYDCGACGGHAGDVSARVMAQVLNDPRVRAGLNARGVHLADTWFGAALHDTTRDRVELCDQAPAHCRGIVMSLLDDLHGACDSVAMERARLLPGEAPNDLAGLRRALDRRAVDWAQVRPEWGLARNAAIVIGPRELTAGLDLDGRVFLQSYRPDLDDDGQAIDFLLGAPLVVAQWISMQYWCSTVDPLAFGAGDKTTHNVISAWDGGPAPLTGVLTGSRGDLRIGLPWQAVSATAPMGRQWTSRPTHEPLRLLAVVYAHPAAVETVLEQRPEVARLVTGEWIDLVVVDPATGQLVRRNDAGAWKAVGDSQHVNATAGMITG